jgi:HlyD family secretion protein
MRANWTRRLLWGTVAVIAAMVLVWFAWPAPLAVDLAAATRGSMEVTVSDDGKAHVRHVYTVSAPIPGKVLRISHPPGEPGVSIHVGDKVAAAESVVAIMQPTVPSFLDVRSRKELQATLTAAEAAVTLAEAEIRRIDAALDFARGELRRAEALAQTNTIAARNLEKARLDVQTSEAALASAKAQLDVRRSEHASVSARLIDPAGAPAASAGCCIQLRAPVTGVVLKIIQDSEATVPAGAPLVDVGDPLDLEIVADLLSSDAARIRVGNSVRIDGWGGVPLRGRVTRVDPAGFLKVSALGIEEQRVRVTIDLVDPPAAWATLGHEYRVVVHVTTWQADDVLTVPVSALFRRGEDWAVFSVKDGRAQTAVVKIGQRNNRMAEVISGLAEDDRVVLHPSDRIKEGGAVSQRTER